MEEEEKNDGGGGKGKRELLLSVSVNQRLPEDHSHSEERAASREGAHRPVDLTE